LKFYICDDNYEFAKKLRGDILRLMPDSDITLFPTISSLMFSLEDNGDSVDAIFLDIEISDGNGIDAAAEIKSKFPLIKLIFATGHGDQYSQDIFNCPVGFEPIAFLIKPVKEKYLKLALDKIKNAAVADDKFLTITVNRTKSFIPIKDIVYISSDKRKLVIHTKNDDYSYYEKLETLVSKLDKRFCRCHRSYIVNLDYLSSFEPPASVTMTNNSVIPMGKSFLKEFKDRLVIYMAANRKGEQNV